MKFKYNFFLFSFLSITFLTISSYPQQMKSKIKTKMMKEQITKAVCLINSTKGHKAHGLIIFSKVENGIKVVANIQGLKPGKHGFHIHEYGDCSAVDGKSAGGHFNPDNVNHGGPMDKIRHAGDLGNIVADVNGNAKLEFTAPTLTFWGQHSIIGRAVIIHEGEDDLHTQPTGAAGSRAGCGVIGIAK
ncbi:MAG: superoxide dismutase family protein [Ignavibacteriales bacterium CG12_big_fil_rev_8_21_14_0_65_30_8]|nr:MAG: superoxide dismutase family protein [Ignavibacteriales bacterium CG12_big_fil_rev_8_21_14_0_65_30_8]